MIMPEILNPLLKQESRIATKKKKVEWKKHRVITVVEQEDDMDLEVSIQNYILVSLGPDKS